MISLIYLGNGIIICVITLAWNFHICNFVKSFMTFSTVEDGVVNFHVHISTYCKQWKHLTTYRNDICLVFFLIFFAALQLRILLEMDKCEDARKASKWNFYFIHLRMLTIKYHLNVKREMGGRWKCLFDTLYANG